MIRKFADSYFVVTFTGECPESKLIHGWDAVLSYIDEQFGNKPDTGSVCDADCSLHDPDNWLLLGGCYRDNDDERHTFDENEFGYCVGLHIVRLTEEPVL